MKQHLVDTVNQNLTDPDHRPLWEWAAEEVRLPPAYAVTGRFSIDNVPFIKEPMRALLDPMIREVVCMSGVQCLKTLCGELWSLFCIAEEPGPFQWLQPTDEDAKEHARERFNQLIKMCPKAESFYTADRHDKRTTGITFRHGMFMQMEGAKNLRNLQRKSIKNQFCSEVWLWPQGHLGEAEARQTQFTWNRKRYVESQAGVAGDDMDLRYRLGTQELLHIRCLECGHPQPLKWTVFKNDGCRAGIRWDDNDVTRKKDGAWRLDALKPTVRYECVRCGHPHFDEPLTRRRLLDSAHYVAQNPDAPPWIRSFSWNQLIMINLSWFDQVCKFIEAMEEDKKGNDKPKIEFFQKRIAEPYDPDLFLAHVKPAAYDSTESEWADEFVRFLTVDVQEGEFWFVVRAWAKSGESRLLDEGKLYTWGEVREKQLEHKILDQATFIDSGYNTRTVYHYCVRNGHLDPKGRWCSWWALKGEDNRQHFTFRAKKAKRTILLPYSWPPSEGDPAAGLEGNAQGKKAKVVLWSNSAIKDILFRLRDNKGAPWLTYEGVSEEWQKQIRSERAEKYLDPKTNRERRKYVRIGKRANHLLDCEAMQVAAACMGGIIGPIGEA